jgi:transcriptional regulator GlxA family with amidase domain
VKVALVIEQLRADITRPISVEALAELVNMSESSLFQHFKHLRLTTARQIVLLEEASASSAAYRVGYQSPSQFSREYTRMFGRAASPRHRADQAGEPGGRGPCLNTRRSRWARWW